MRTPMSEEEKAFFRAFGQRLAALRQDRGFSQAELGEILGRSQQQVQAFEKGRRRIPVSGLPTLAKALEVPVETLLGMDETPGKPGPSSKLERQLEQLAKLPRSKQKVVSEMLDGLLQQAS